VASVAAIILAAGKGSRMGQPKLLLQWDGKPFRQRILDAIQPLELFRVITVVSPDLISHLKGETGSIAVNPTPELGMLSSLRMGIAAAPDADGYLLIPVDHPFVRTETYRTLLDAYHENPLCIVKPVYQGRGGHPVIVPHDVARQIPERDVEGGLNAILRMSGAQEMRVLVEDAGILRNINVPDDLK
jgi:molybdenum cofactor cytidylyltransferase